MTEDLKRFKKLFQGNKRSYGIWDKNSGAMFTKKIPYEDSNFEDHIRGKVGLGIVPILDNSKCYFAAIDIDAHGADEEIDLIALEAAVRKIAPALVVCRSKSGGAHLYAFFLEPVMAEDARSLLSKYSKDLGYPGVEIFPKQSKLYKDDQGDLALGNWINLPYFRAHDTNRYMILRGAKSSLDLFLTEAEAKRMTPEWLSTQILGEHSEAPPCVQKMYVDGVKHYRNESLFAIAVYLRRRFPMDWIDRAHDVNRQVMDSPLPHAEVKRTLLSIQKKDYSYRCKDEPCKSMCNRAECLIKKYGITPEEEKQLESEDLQFSNLKKILTKPPKWELDIQEKTVFLDTATLMDFNKLRAAIFEQLTIVLPGMKNFKWHDKLSSLTESCVYIEAPDEASVPGQMLEKLEDFIQRADLKGDGDNPKQKEDLTRGLPVLQNIDNDRVVMFRGKDFIEFLKRTRSEELKGSNLWAVMRSLGVSHKVVRIPNRGPMRVWCLPVDKDGGIEIVEPEILEEF